MGGSLWWCLWWCGVNGDLGFYIRLVLRMDEKRWLAETLIYRYELYEDE